MSNEGLFTNSKQKDPERSSKLVKGALSVAAMKFGVTADTVSAIWKRAQQFLADGHISADLGSFKCGHVGRKKKDSDVDKVKVNSPVDRQNIRSLPAKLNMSRHCSSSPQRRVKFCLSMLDPVQAPLFQDMMNTVHIDKKWFYITKTNAKYYRALGKQAPHRTYQSKRFITKVMFLAAVARPRFDSYHQRKFDGRTGMLPFVYQEAAKRCSKNCEAGALETKCIQSISKEEVKKKLIKCVLPAIREKWPKAWRGKTSDRIVIQQDSARPHPSGDGPDLVNELKKDGFNISLHCQPPNSPDMNVLDLGLFRSIQSLQHQIPKKK
ncbi:uncharacterized protein PHALS_02214 [Plasmopara halstedii]|uniref:Uncharacterized protein n=1 Tax=Plasmopara halstedii TaxID=4781 RepID=A0A0N7L3M7_PLAHL|nr:uncharacterized protein PHALS_02214 [Plasmopara halstedii]CEG36307.1 hypothetical protein PHALS_02214 [Plasmopara halstedii]|eukprot:XP_024572676.1 hypothetical protein PHALS_02214 [Plasmopara halstedii]